MEENGYPLKGRVQQHQHGNLSLFPPIQQTSVFHGERMGHHAVVTETSPAGEFHRGSIHLCNELSIIAWEGPSFTGVCEARVSEDTRLFN